MNNPKYKPTEFEEVSQKAGDAYSVRIGQQKPKPFLVVDNLHRPRGPSIGGVSEIMDFLLAQGSMPA